MSFIDKLFEKSMPGTEKLLDLTWRRNEALTSNIANAETPGYRAVDLSFANELKHAFESAEQQVAQTNPKHMDISSDSMSHLVPDYSGATKADGNNVDIDIQMGRLAYNNGRYGTAANVIRKHFQFIKNAIREGGR